jgi:hypothetical protein
VSEPKTLPTVQVGERTFTILFPDLAPPLSDHEIARLRRSIRKHGVRVPVVVDENDGVIDGANRLRLAAKLGEANVPVEVHPGLTEQQKIELAYSLNEDRRQLHEVALQAMRKERIARIARLRRQGLSTREIAEQEQVSQGQVCRDLAEATESGDSVDPPGGMVRGRDGKERPARRDPKKTPPPEQATPPLPEQHQPPGAEPESPVAANGPGPGGENDQGRETPTAEQEVPTGAAPMLPFGPETSGGSEQATGDECAASTQVNEGHGGAPRPSAKKSPLRGKHFVSRDEAYEIATAADDLLARLESATGFRALVSRWGHAERWGFCDRLERVSRQLRKLSDGLRHAAGPNGEEVVDKLGGSEPPRT